MATKQYTTICDVVNVVPTTNWKKIKGMDWGGNTLSFAFSGDGTTAVNYLPSYQYTSSNSALTSLTNFTADYLPVIFSANTKLRKVDNIEIDKYAYCAFSRCSSLSSVTNCTLKNDASACFQVCSGLKTFQGSTSAVTNGRYLFYNANHMQTMQTDGFDNLTNGQSMFAMCSSFTEDFSYSLPKLITGDDMFNESHIHSFSGDMPSLTSAVGMFALNTYMSGAQITANSLTDGSAMFYGNISMKVVDLHMKNVTELSGACSDCIALTNATVYAPSATGAYMLFGVNSGQSGMLSSVTADLSSLQTYTAMFQYQPNLSYVRLILPYALIHITADELAIPSTAPCRNHSRYGGWTGDTCWVEFSEN